MKQAEHILKYANRKEKESNQRKDELAQIEALSKITGLSMQEIKTEIEMQKLKRRTLRNIIIVVCVCISMVAHGSISIHLYGESENAVTMFICGILCAMFGALLIGISYMNTKEAIEDTVYDFEETTGK